MNTMEQKKVLFFIYQMGKGGAARTLLNIMNNLDRQKFKPILVTLNYNGEYEQYVKDDIQFIKLKQKRLRNAIFPLAKVIRNVQADIVFSTIPNYNTIAILANKFSFSKAKSIVREADNLGGSRLVDLKLRLYGMLYRTTDQVVSLSEGVKENLVKKYKVKRENIEVIYNPIDLKHIEQEINSGKLPKEHEQIFQKGEPVVITAGRLVKQKDHFTLIKAFAETNKKVPSQLVILGEGPLKDELMQLSQTLNVNERVHFLGFQDNPYIYFHKANLFVLTSIHEGFSHVIAEALACGTPVVSTDCKSGPSEVLDKGKYGMLCEVGNVDEISTGMLQTLTLNQNELEKIQQLGIKRATYFNADKIVQQYEDLFINTLN